VSLPLLLEFFGVLGCFDNNSSTIDLTSKDSHIGLVTDWGEVGDVEVKLAEVFFDILALCGSMIKSKINCTC